MIRWRKRGLNGDLGSHHSAEIREGGLLVCELRVTRERHLPRGRRMVTRHAWRISIHQPGGITLLVGGISWPTLAAAKASAERELTARGSR